MTKKLATIGSMGHDWSSMSSVIGSISGIAKFTRGSYFNDVIGLQGFNFLEEGETQIFEEAPHIEVVDFNAHEVKMRAWKISYAETFQVDLEKGAVLSGPVAWREAQPYTSDLANSGTDVGEWVCGVLILMIVAGLGYSVGYLWGAVFAAIGLFAFFKSASWNAIRRDVNLLKKIEADGSCLIRGPKRKFWS